MNNQQIKTFLQGGKATFTLKSLKTGAHYTFQAAKNDTGTLLWISLLTGPDTYTYMGTVKTATFLYTETAKSIKGHGVHKVLHWFFKLLANGKTNDDLVFHHAGKCSKCQRKLTDPESIETGLGPICRNSIG